jgi:dTDP-4-amino-4,6-dideoxygalactose transaminase
VPSFTFAASVNVILYEKAIPVFVDIEPETYNLDPKVSNYTKLLEQGQGVL